MSMDNITILRDPPQKYWDISANEVSTKYGWVTSSRNYEILKNGFPDGNFVFLVAVNSKTQEFIGSVCVATYMKPEPLSAIGMYVVMQEYQGKGVGTRLFDAMLELCASRKFLYGAADMMPKYRDKYGFDKIPDWHILTYKVEMKKVKPLQLNHDPTLIVKHPLEVGWEAVIKYYHKFLSQLDCGNLVKALFEGADCHVGVALTQENRIVALVRVRELCNNELGIGPWLGNDGIAACTALRHVLCQLENLREFKGIKIECPNTNSESRDFLVQLTDGDLKLSEKPCYPQFTQEIFELPVHHIYAVSQSDVTIV